MPESTTLLMNETDLLELTSFSIHDADIPALRNTIAKMTEIGYCETVICKRLGLSDLTELQWRALPVYRKEKLAAHDALASAIDLFLLQGIIPEDTLDPLLDDTDREVLIRAGLLSIDENGFARAGATLYPVGNHLIFSDHAWPMLPNPGYDKFPYDQVMFIGPDSRWLAHATVRRPARAALDLCTGSGIHALLAASHSERVSAVDINPRAVHCTRFNALVSGLTNIETFHGDLYEPVRGECFDLITANPPFVPAPVDTIRFRDGGSSGEEIQRRIITGLPDHLAQGGIAQIVTELGERDDESLSDRLRGWLNHAPMDIYILRLGVRSATDYAIGHAEGNTYADFLDSVAEWAGNLKTQGYSRIVSVLLAFEWSDPELGPPWTRSEESLPPNKYVGDEVEATFLVERLVRNPKFEEILEHSLLRRPSVGMMEARILGDNLGLSAQARLFDKTLSNVQPLTPVERQILLLMDKPLTFTELIHHLNLEREVVFEIVASLLRRKLVLLD